MNHLNIGLNEINYEKRFEEQSKSLHALILN
jgi:hypothetical protein